MSERSPEPGSEEWFAQFDGLKTTPAQEQGLHPLSEGGEEEKTAPENRPGPGNHDPEINADNYDYYQPFEKPSEEQKETNREGMKRLREDNPDLFPDAPQ